MNEQSEKAAWTKFANDYMRTMKEARESGRAEYGSLALPKTLKGKLLHSCGDLLVKLGKRLKLFSISIKQ